MGRSNYNTFYKKVLDHISGFNEWGAGYYKNYRDKNYPHIANIENKLQLNIVRDILESDGVETDLYHKPHSCAHHMNSSQVMCYEFFRPMMTAIPDQNYQGQANKDLVRFVKETIGVNIAEGAICQFEYEDKETCERFKSFSENDGKGEKSQFDFYIKDGETEIFFEIKYTEATFGGWTKTRKTSWKSIKNHCAYVERGYKPMMEKSTFFTPKSKKELQSIKEQGFSDSKLTFNKQYQLFRNALKADETKYTVFIFPKANPNPTREFELFKENLVEGQNHIIALRWEDLSPYIINQKFYDKFIKGLI